SACIRIPAYSNSEGAKRIEYRSPDPTANPYLAFSAMLMAGLDGIINKIDPGDPMDLDLYETPTDVAQVPGALDLVLDALESDHEFLLRGGVFTQDLIDVWIAWKRKYEVDAIRMRPHPYEYQLYYDM
ncbi:MAG: type I glutamate--ammonia ligase, partial [Anaerolineae bacterium]|nr:type I glutamate--ammonia ligase [Anaerolineae bacterium]